MSRKHSSQLNGSEDVAQAATQYAPEGQCFSALVYSQVLENTVTTQVTIGGTGCDDNSLLLQSNPALLLDALRQNL